MAMPTGSPLPGNGQAELTYLAEERTFGAWLRTALTLQVTALAVARFIYEREPSVEVLAISLLLLAGAGTVTLQAYSRFLRACARASVHGVRVPPRSLLLVLFLILFSTVVLAFALVVRS
jgi:uncharacterized membrane protein YidH (DUF202 family)